MSDHSWGIAPALQRYLRQINPPEAPILQALRADTVHQRQGKMAIAPEQSQLLTWLAALLQARTYLEIGVFTGYSSTAMALALPEDGRITACDISVTYTDIAQHYWQQAGVRQKIDLHLQPAIITLDALIDAGKHDCYDMALIDADKAPTPHYFERCLTLLRAGGVLAIDNVLLHGRVTTPPPPEAESPSVDIMHAFNAQLAEDPRVHVLTLPIGDGLTLVQKKRTA